MRRRGRDSQEDGEGLQGLKTSGQVEQVWLSRGDQGDPVFQTNNKHTEGLWEVWARSKIAFLLLETKHSLCRAVWGSPADLMLSFSAYFSS